MAKKKPTKKPAKKKSNNPNGRPLIKIDKGEVEKLARLGCNDTEIGNFFGVHPTTIGKRFSVILTKGRAERKAKLRQMQWKAAEGGNIAMLIWLGKQELGQIETIKHEGGQIDPVTVMLNSVGKQIETNPALKKKTEKELND